MVPGVGRYEGEYVNNVRHGHAVIDFESGKHFEGEYRNDKRNGKGILTDQHGYRYDGEFLDDERHGYAVVDYATGSHFEGYFVDGHRSGRGILPARMAIGWKGFGKRINRTVSVRSGSMTADILRETLPMASVPAMEFFVGLTVMCIAVNFKRGCVMEPAF